MTDLFLIWKADVQTALFLLTGLLAWRFGAGPERYSAAVLILAKVADVLLHLIVGKGASFRHIETGHLVYDLITLAAFLAIALKANRTYPLWLSSFQLFAVMGHFASGMKTAAPMAYAVMAILPSYALILVTLLGIWAHARRTRRFGATRAWRSSLPIHPSQGKDRSLSP